MDVLREYGKEIAALLVPVVTWLLNRLNSRSVKLLRGTRHAFTFIVDQPLLNDKGEVVAPTQLAHTASVVLHNKGRATATNVEIVFNYPPMCINFWPQRSYTKSDLFDGRRAYKFDSLAPDEFLGFELLGVNANLPALVTARCDQGVAQEVHLVPHQAQPRWKIQLVIFLSFMGMAATAYAMLVLLQLLVLGTPSLFTSGV